MKIWLLVIMVLSIILTTVFIMPFGYSLVFALIWGTGVGIINCLLMILEDRHEARNINSILYH